MAKIPTKLKQIAADLGCNVINYLTTTKEGEVFSLAATDDYGNYIDLGLPVLFACNGDDITPISQEEIQKILSSINE